MLKVRHNIPLPPPPPETPPLQYVTAASLEASIISKADVVSSGDWSLLRVQGPLRL